jgi:hypothetical protein
MDHELHAPGFVEKALEDDRLLGGHHTERGAGGGQIFGQLLARGSAEAQLFCDASRRKTRVEPRCYLFAQT